MNANLAFDSAPDRSVAVILESSHRRLNYACQMGPIVAVTVITSPKLAQSEQPNLIAPISGLRKASCHPCQIDSQMKQALTCCNIKTTRSIGIPGGRRHSPKREKAANRCS